MDLSVENIAKLHNKCKNQNDDLYIFLKKEFPDLSVEDRLKYLSTILNDFFEEYKFNQNDRHSDEGYSIVKFFPK
jgi:hypothetical protein